MDRLYRGLPGAGKIEAALGWLRGLRLGAVVVLAIGAWGLIIALLFLALYLLG